MNEPFTQAPRTSPPPRPPKNGQNAKHVNGVDSVSSHHIDADYARESPPGVPRWVKGLGIALFVLALLFAGLHVAGSGEMHMPGAHGGEHGMQLP
jgi:hypothetical protein